MAFDAGIVEGLLKLRDEFTGVLDRAVLKLEKSSDKIKKRGQQMTDAGSALTTAFTVPLAIIGTASVVAFASFDDAMTKSLAIMGDVSVAMEDDMADAAREVAKTLRVSATDAAESFFFLASAGLDAAQSIEALPRVAKFAQAGNFDMARATDLLTDAQSALGLTIRDDVVANMENMTRVSDVLVKANTVANASVEQFATSLTSKAGAAMRQLNITVESGVAVLAAWADQGVKAELAGERFNIVTRDLQTAALKNVAAFKQMGIAVFDSSGAFRSMADIISDMETAFAGMSTKQQKSSLMMLGFTDRSVQATRSLLGLSDRIRAYEKQLLNAAGTTQLVSDKQMRSFAAQMGLIQDRLIDVAISIGEALVPVLRSLMPIVDRAVELLDDMVEAFNALPTPLKAIAIGMLAMLAAVGPVVLIYGKLLIMFSSVIAIAPAVKTALLLMMGPWGLLAAAVAAVVVITTVWIAKQNKLLSMTVANVKKTGTYAEKVKALRGELFLAVEEQRALNDQYIVAVRDSLPGLEKAMDKVRQRLKSLDKAGQGLFRTTADGVAIQNEASAEYLEQLEHLEDLQAQLNFAKAALESANEQQQKFGKSVADAVAEEEEQVEVTDNLIDVFGGLRESLNDSIKRSLELRNAEKQGAVAVRDLTIKHEAYDRVLSTGITAIEATNAGLFDLAEKAIKAERGIVDLTSSTDDIVELTERTASAFTSTGDAMGVWDEATKSYLNTGETFSAGLRENNQLAERSHEVYDLLKQTFDVTGKSQTELLDITRKLSAAVQDGTITADQFDNAMLRMRETSTRMARDFASLVTVITSGSISIGQAFAALFTGELRDSFSGFLDNVKQGFGKFKEGFQAARGSGEGLFSSLKAGMQETGVVMGQVLDSVVLAFKAAGGKSEDIMKSALGAIQSFASGDFIGGVIKAVGAVVGAIKKLFGGGKSIEQRVGDLFKKFEEGKGTFKELTKLAQLLAEGFNKVTFKGKANELARSTELLNASFNDFVDLALQFGTQGTAAIAQVVNAAKRAGADMSVVNARLAETMTEALDILAERNEFIIERSQTIAQQLLGFLSDVTLTTAADVQFAATSVMQAFASMLTAGLPLSQVLAELGDTFALIGERGQALGVELGDEFTRIGEVMSILANERLQKVIERLQQMSDVTRAVGDMGLLTEGQFASLSDRIDMTFERLSISGLTGAEALASIAPQLQLLHDLSQQYGFTIDENTQLLLDQAMAQGLVADRGLTTESILIRGFDRLIEGLNALIRALGGVPIALEQWGTTTDVVSQDIQDRLDDLGGRFDDMGQRGRRAFDQIGDAAVANALRAERAIASVGDAVDNVNGAIEASPPLAIDPNASDADSDAIRPRPRRRRRSGGGLDASLAATEAAAAALDKQLQDQLGLSELADNWRALRRTISETNIAKALRESVEGASDATVKALELAGGDVTSRAFLAAQKAIDKGLDAQLKEIGKVALLNLGGVVSKLRDTGRETVREMSFLADNLETFGLSAEKLTAKIQEGILPGLLAIGIREAKRVGDLKAVAEFEAAQAEIQRVFTLVQLKIWSSMLTASGDLDSTTQRLIDRVRELVLTNVPPIDIPPIDPPEVPIIDTAPITDATEDIKDAFSDVAEKTIDSLSLMSDVMSTTDAVISRIDISVGRLADTLSDSTVAVDELSPSVRTLNNKLVRMARIIGELISGDSGQLPGFARGSPGFVDFGQGTLAELHNDEQVVTRVQGESLAAMVSGAIADASNRGGGDGANDSTMRSLLSESRAQTDAQRDIIAQQKRTTAGVENLSRRLSRVEARGRTQPPPQGRTGGDGTGARG